MRDMAAPQLIAAVRGGAITVRTSFIAVFFVNSITADPLSCWTGIGPFGLGR